MRIVINQGANLPQGAIDHYEIAVAPAHILVDDVEHDTRDPISHETLDSWVKTARDFPHVVGTTAQEFAHVMMELARIDPEILVVAASRKLIQTHGAALTAARTLQKRSAFAHVNVAVIDSLQVDIGTGLLALVAGEARLAKVPMRIVVTTLETMAARMRFSGTVATLDNLVRGGRAGFLRAWLADVLDVKPLLGMIDGELKSVGKIRSKVDPVDALADDLSKLGAGRRVWIGIAHGSVPDRAAALRRALEHQFDVAYTLTMPLNPSVYLHAGRGSLFATVFPIDNLAWAPTTPPDF